MNVSKMNITQGGAQLKMRDTTLKGKPQSMVLSNGCPKVVMKMVLEECGTDTENMKAADMGLIVGGNDNFKHKNCTQIFTGCKRTEVYYVHSQFSLCS